MAFEVFDDVAFYWFLMSVMVAVIVPMSYSFLSTVQWKSPADWTRTLGSCKEKVAEGDRRRRKEMAQKLLGWRGIGFIGCWVLFIALLLRLTAMQSEEMFSFNPYKILDIEEGATPQEIKKACPTPPYPTLPHPTPPYPTLPHPTPLYPTLQAYRQMSLLYHPDKNPDAGDIFIKISKAYNVLTDDASRENYEKYGNADGYHGTSVTIGLPSWLTNKVREDPDDPFLPDVAHPFSPHLIHWILFLFKDNELAILVAYFVVLIVVIPVVVGLWWRNSSKFLEDGVMQNTAYRFYRQVQENTAAKYMPGILASAVEFCEGVPCKNAQAGRTHPAHLT